jgi:hypothetical protein
VIADDVVYEQSDHHKLPYGSIHPRLYPRQGEFVGESW